ncbi:hypothetical protein AC1031_011094 [Aphanomyces cochlioides]|nr:hypothetical protein AC1031_011094 [Aphanomyces cochlioides]
MPQLDDGPSANPVILSVVMVVVSTPGNDPRRPSCRSAWTAPSQRAWGALSRTRDTLRSRRWCMVLAASSLSTLALAVMNAKLKVFIRQTRSLPSLMWLVVCRAKESSFHSSIMRFRRH